ncbi:hypothetical protein BCD67_16380 [Oscillatoriales cyanobacterium USR001]|nr:hypothetical protein BCD67_16380 [Oscillatoriales cyanobacterium USR001]
MQQSKDDLVEVDGIRFQTLVPEHALPIPPLQPGADTPVQFGIRITNNTQTSHRFLLFFLFPTFLNAEGQVIKSEGPAINKTNVPQEADFPLAKSGESLIFFVKGRFVWDKNQIKCVVYLRDGGAWSFRNFQPGTHQVRFTYSNKTPVWNIYDGRLLKTSIEDVWTGMISTYFVDLHLVNSIPHNSGNRCNI